MKKVYLTAAVVAAMSATFVACTNEFEAPVSPDTAVAEGQTGRVVFNVNTGKDVSFTRTGDVAEDQVINKLSVFLFDADGKPVPGVQKDYEGTDLTDGKLVVALPADQMNKTGFKAYLTANVVFGNIPQTEEALQGWISTISPAEVSENGIPMVSGPITLNTTVAVVTAEAVMKRSMSSLFVKVNPVASGGTTINAGDFTYKVKNVRVDKGYMFKDEVCTGAISSATWTPKTNTNAEELLGYMYQSNGFEVEITPKVGKPELGSASRTVVVAADKARKRNKKYLLNVMPTVSENGQVDFTITVQEWDATGGSFNVDWADHISLNSRLPQGIITQKGGLVATNVFETMGTYDNIEVNYGSVNSLFRLSTGCRIANVQAEGLMTDYSGLRIKDGILTSNRYKAPLLEDTKGSLLVTTEKEGVQAKNRFSFTIKGALARPKEGFNHRWERENAGWATYSGRIEIQNIYALGNWDARLPVNSVFDIAKDYQITEIASNEALNNWEARLIGGSGNGAKAIVGLIDGKVRFRQVGHGFGHINFYVQIKHVPSNTFVVRKMTLRFKGK